MESKQRTVVITGATSGIGKRLTETYAINEDCTVFGGFRNPEHKKELESISSNVIPFNIDMEKPSLIDWAAMSIKRRVSKVDLLINAAGCVMAGPMETMPAEKLKKQFDINTFSHLRFTQQLMDVLQDGKVINISSMASFGIFPFVAPYCASKRALDILFTALEIESNYKVKVISIKPGVIATPLWEKSIKNNQDSIVGAKDYEKQMAYVAGNAERNGTRGLSPDKVVEVILKADRAKNPKPSYTVGKDAFAAELVSRLPQCFINKIIEYGMKKKGFREPEIQTFAD